MAFGWKDIRHFYHLSDLSSRATNKQKEIQVISYFNRDIKVPPLPSHLETKILIEIVQKEHFKSKSHISMLTWLVTVGSFSDKILKNLDHVIF